MGARGAAGTTRSLIISRSVPRKSPATEGGAATAFATQLAGTRQNGPGWPRALRPGNMDQA